MGEELLLLALGGTISMRIVGDLAVPALGAAELVRLAGIEAAACDLATVGGPQLDFPLLRRVVLAIRDAERTGACGVLVTLGTDAIEEVGAFLAYCGPYRLNLVITGAMLPGGEPDSDGPANLRDAAAIARGPRLPEPVVVFAGTVALAREVVKVSGLDRDAFASPTTPSWSVAEVLAAGGLTGPPAPAALLGDPGLRTEEVPIVVSAMSVGDSLSGGSGKTPKTPAVVCVASGAGNLAPEACAIAQAALADGAVVGIATRALDRRLTAAYGYPGGSGTLVAAGAVLAEGMTAFRLRVFLLIAISQGLRGPALAAALRAHVASL
jgi:L-asparaginase